MVIRTIAEVPEPKVGRGFVPTMGALHEGHLSLIRKAREENEEVVVSIFVNPTQFGPNEDFARYPRQLEKDVDMAVEAGADWFFAPEPSEMYPRRSTSVHVPEVTERFEGERRPGHFDGVATIVLKLFNIVKPTIAYFGRKDLQQCLVIRRMVLDLNVPVELRFCETIRETDGLAKSSRNMYLSEEERKVAPTLYRELSRLRDEKILDEKALELSRSRIRDAGFELDYLDVVDLDTMQAKTGETTDQAIVVAAKIGKTRLIDNVLLNR